MNPAKDTTPVQSVTDDILKQALGEVDSHNFEESSSIIYSDVQSNENTGVLPDNGVNLAHSSASSITLPSSYTLAPPTMLTEIPSGFKTTAIQNNVTNNASVITNNNVLSADNTIHNIPTIDKVTVMPVGHVKATATEIVQQTQQILQNLPKNTPQKTIYVPVPAGQMMEQPQSSGPAPLGSSENPIRIVQQGNRYISTQQLSPEQLAQIMQVVQQQHMSKPVAPPTHDATTLFSPQTQSKVVYRVVQPPPLHKPTLPTPGVRQIASATVQKRQSKKRAREDQRQLEIAYEEKIVKLAKMRKMRTRSGRVSRPPKHWVKEFKHIPSADVYKDTNSAPVSDDEDVSTTPDAPYTSAGIYGGRPKKHKCIKCDKCYIGEAGLLRHYRRVPDHSPPDLEAIKNEQAGETEDTENTPISAAHYIASTTSVPGNKHNPSEFLPNDTDESRDDKSSNMEHHSGNSQLQSDQDIIFGKPAENTSAAVHNNSVTLENSTEAPIAQKVESEDKSAKTKPSVPAHHPEMTRNKRKLTLRQLLRQCSRDELIDIVAPRLVKVLSTWDYLLLKCERVPGCRLQKNPRHIEVIQEFERLQRSLQRMCKNQLEPCDMNNTHVDKLEITSETLAQSLGIKMGSYRIRVGDTNSKTDSNAENRVPNNTTTDQPADIGLGKNPIIKIPVNTMTEAESNKPLKLRLDTNTSTNQLIAVQQNPTFNPPLPSTRQKQILKPGSQNISTIKPTTTQHTRPLPVSGSSAGNAQTVTATHVNTSGTIPSSSATRFMIMTADGQMVPISEHQLNGLVQSGADITNVDNTALAEAVVQSDGMNTMLSNYEPSLSSDSTADELASSHSFVTEDTHVSASSQSEELTQENVPDNTGEQDIEGLSLESLPTDAMFVTSDGQLISTDQLDPQLLKDIEQGRTIIQSVQSVDDNELVTLDHGQSIITDETESMITDETQSQHTLPMGEENRSEILGNQLLESSDVTGLANDIQENHIDNNVDVIKNDSVVTDITGTITDECLASSVTTDMQTNRDNTSIALDNQDDDIDVEDLTETNEQAASSEDVECVQNNLLNIATTTNVQNAILSDSNTVGAQIADESNSANVQDNQDENGGAQSEVVDETGTAAMSDGMQVMVEGDSVNDGGSIIAHRVMPVVEGTDTEGGDMNVKIFQTEDGLLLVQREDGSLTMVTQ